MGAGGGLEDWKETFPLDGEDCEKLGTVRGLGVRCGRTARRRRDVAIGTAGVGPGSKSVGAQLVTAADDSPTETAVPSLPELLKLDACA